MLCRALVLTLACGFAACIAPTGFVCARSSDCAPGVCQPDTHFCSFADTTCPSGERYGGLAGDLSDACVPPGTTMPPPACGKASILTDAFDATLATNAQPPLLWQRSWHDPLTSYAQTGGKLLLTLAPNTTQYTGYGSTLSYDLREDHVFVAATTVPTSPHALAYLQLVEPAPGGNDVTIIFEGGQLYFEVGSAALAQVTYDPVQHKYWQIRETGGHFLWQTSPDASAWSTQLDRVDPIDPTQVYINLVGGEYQGDATPGTAAFDDFNGGAASTEKLCAAASLTDDFSDGVRGAVWAGSYQNGGCTSSETGSELVMTPAANTASTFCAYLTTGAYDLTGSTVAVRVPTVPNPATGAEAYLRLNDAFVGDDVALVEQAGMMRLEKVISGTRSTLATFTYDAATQLWWRLREAGGQLCVDTHGATGTWLNQRCVAAPIALGAVTIQLGAGTTAATASPGTAHFAGFNLGPP